MEQLVLAIGAAGAVYLILQEMRKPPAGVEVVTGAPAGGVVPALDQSKPRGIRNRNPGNIKWSDANKWQGQIGKDGGGFVVFDTPENGLRAMAKLLKNYIKIKNLNTPAKIILRWSPDVNGLNGSYAKGVFTYSGLAPNVIISATDNGQIAQLMKGMIAVENGAAYLNYYPPAKLLTAANSV